MKKIFIISIIFLLLASCKQHTANQAQETYEYTDDYGQTVAVPTHPRRVVSLSPAVTEIMFALGADSLLVGRTEFCLFPPEARAIENIGGISNLNVEKVLSCHPDLIISGSMVPRKIVEQFATMGVPLVSVIEKQHFDALYENITKIGGLVGHSQQADSLNRVLRVRVDTLLNQQSSMSTLAGTPAYQTRHAKPTVYYVVGYGSGGNFTAGGNTFINDIIEMAGGANIAKESKGWTFSVEALMQSDPDFILIRREDSASFCRATPYSQLSAVRQGRTIALEDGILDLQVPRNVDVILRLSKAFRSTAE